MEKLKLFDWLDKASKYEIHSVLVRSNLRRLPSIYSDDYREKITEDPEIRRLEFIVWLELHRQWWNAFSSKGKFDYSIEMEIKGKTDSYLKLFSNYTFEVGVRFLYNSSSMQPSFFVDVVDMLSRPTPSGYADEESIHEDIEFLIAEPNGAVIEQPLWLRDVRGDQKFRANMPASTRTPFDRFAKTNLCQGGWKHWASWYREILPNDILVSPRPSFSSQVHNSLATAKTTAWASLPINRQLEVFESTINGRVQSYSGNNGSEFNQVQPSPSEEDHPKNPDASGPAGSGSSGDHGPSSREPETPTRSDATITDEADTHADAPASEDLLGRTDFARALADKIRRVHDQSKQAGLADGFAVNLHAPWGAGKTSVLRMIEARLKAETETQGWLVADFNAWRHESRNPPWFPLMEAVHEDGCRSLRGQIGGAFKAGRIVDGAGKIGRLLWLEWAFFRWRFLSDWLPVAASVGVAVGVASFIWFLAADLDEARGVLTAMSTLVALAGTGWAFSRGLVFGSRDQAKFHFELTRDPLRRIATLFDNMVRAAGAPICVFIDDLDRCESGYVVTFLEGIQTRFRHRDVVYVVAADRKWIKAAFETHYSGAFDRVQNEGQPLGYMFLEKIFQISVPLPSVSSHYREAFWRQLVSKGRQGAVDLEAEVERRSAEFRSRGVDTFEKVAAEMPPENDAAEKDSGDEDRRSSDRERMIDALAGARVVRQSVNTEIQAQHRLADAAKVIPFNPRAMKRMINAYTLRVADGLTVDRAMTPELLARWIILEQSYPGLADLLAEKPSRIKALIGEDCDGPGEADAALLPFLGREEIIDILTHDHLGEPLTQRSVRLFTQGLR